MSEYTIWKQLRAAGLTQAGAAGLLGNMYCESGLKANIAQRGMTSYSDEEYTRRADNKLLSFEFDSVGYGLCQWTFSTRKAELLKYAKECGVSVGDENMQVRFCLREFPSEAPQTFQLLKETDDIYAAAEWVCRYYERPEDNNVDARYEAARKIWARCTDLEAMDISNADPAEDDDPESTAVPPAQATLTLPELRNGDHSEAVRSLQELLTKNGYSVGFCGCDAWFGDKTEKALRMWQETNELPIDGVCKAADWYFLITR